MLYVYAYTTYRTGHEGAPRLPEGRERDGRRELPGALAEGNITIMLNI